jgi:hypothetical protein
MTDLIKLRPDGIEWREIDGEIVALDVAASRYLAGNRTAAALWPKLVEGASRDEFVRELTARFDVDAETAGRDLDSFLRGLDARGLLER